jgi:ABC-2 type transport system ATP-binding protein
MNSPNDFAITTDGLGKSYKEITALKALDLRVRKHSIFGFLGPNGAGKTTTIKLLLGLSRPTSGKAYVFGLDVDRDSLEIRRRIGYLPQEPRFFDYMTARQTLRFALRFYFSGPKVEIDKRVADSLDFVGLADKADRPVKGFSGGEKQRLGIAQAQVHQPDLLILDEPTANLDPMGRRNVLQVMERLRESSTIFYSTHILDDVERVSDSVAILKHGRLIAQAPIDELLTGTGDKIYVVVLRGDGQPIYEHISSLPWVSEIQSSLSNGLLRWQIHVTDTNKAESQLFTLLTADKAAHVVEFGHKKHDLEDVFVDLVGEGGDESK